MPFRSLVVVAVLGACGSTSAPPQRLEHSSASASASNVPAPSQKPSLATPWIAKLSDPREAERAVTELEQLGDPSAIEPLGQHWTDAGRPVRVLQVMISLARPLTADEAKNQFFTDYEQTGRPASWDRVLPYLRAAIATIDLDSPRSVDSATKAASAIEEARLVGALPELGELATRPPNKKWLVVQIGAIRALGAIGGAEATRTLLGLIGHEPPAHPRTGAKLSRDDRRGLEERFTLELARTGAAINALGAPGTTAAAETLMKQLYLTPELFLQIRRALVANGPVVTELVQTIMRGTHDTINTLIAERKLDRYCGDAGDRPAAQCEPVSIRDFYAAQIAGDLHDEGAVPELLEVLKRPAAPSYYSDNIPSPNTQHRAALNALSKLDAEEAAAPVRAMWKAPKLDVGLRAGAIEAYPFLVRSDADVEALGTIAADNATDDGVRQEAATAYARLAHEPKNITFLLTLADRYVVAAAKKRQAADAAKPATAKADAALAKVEKPWTTAKIKLVELTKDPAVTAERIKAATKATTQLELNYREAKKRHRQQTAMFRTLDQAAIAYTGFARMFQTHVARIEIAIHCKTDIACFGETLKQPPADVVARIKRYLPDVDAWTADEKQALAESATERALIEIGKRGSAAAELTDTLLEQLTLRQPTIANSILLALPRIAKRPCPACVTRLDAVIAAVGDDPSFQAASGQAALVRSYFRWAK